MAPRGGSEIVRTVLSSPDLREKWGEDLKTMSGRIKAMRQALYDELVKLDTPGKWEHILAQVSMGNAYFPFLSPPLSGPIHPPESTIS